jgi:hypothetical protein
MEKISIKINNKEIPLTEFPKSIIINTILGMLQALKGVDKIITVEIKINKE